jgi:hypothetical protein
MKNYFRRTIIALTLLLLLTTSLSAETRDDYELTVAAIAKALQGWKLYENKEFAGTFKSGRYTDTDPAVAGNDFWSDGVIATVDREGDGHHETYFKIENKQLIYVGSIGGHGNFVHTALASQRYQGQPIAAFIRDTAKK